ncbi:hypothetical protein AXF42_Ash002034 [Apostasia shenzhenica]|uniref:Uncharacterized protein n=1 Tax=Apostasia shenzhenica TaxID=1088818 RepID=A0A2I0ABX5_9ASPA|nr:hypothetical protein AXF42_Ash002034 [Apostasia shenzhenica]
MPKASSPSPTITPMNPIKTHPQTLTLAPAALALTAQPGGGIGAAAEEDSEDLFQTYHLHPQSLLIDDDNDEEQEPPPSPDPVPLSSSCAALNPSQTLDAHPQSPFSSFLFRDPDDEEEEEEDDPVVLASHNGEVEDFSYEAERHQKPDFKSSSDAGVEGAVVPPLPYVDPLPHISSQFYTFNRESHALMVHCILERRLATPDEIRRATPPEVLRSWRLVWKDRNEDTAYLTAWKRIQDKLHAHVDGHSNHSLFFKSNPSQRVSHVEQWQDIVASFHADPDLLRHLGLKETVDRIKQSWTVGAKFYGIPESFIRVCISSCLVCSSITSGGSSAGGNLASRSKRRRFEYTESFDVPARDVPHRLQQLAAKHKVVLCIRQKYIRYKPFMAEVKDYACHRAGEPSSSSASTKKPRILKREPYQSKRCGCGFRIRAIVPIANYNEKDKTFVYQEEGTAVFKLYAVHSGHEPGPLDGNARIIHRIVGHKGGFDLEPDDYGVREDSECDSFVSASVKDDAQNHHHSVLQQVFELRMEAGLLERKISKMPLDMLNSLSCELSDIVNKLRNFSGQHILEDTLIRVDDNVRPWGSQQVHHVDDHDRLFSNKEAETIEEDGEDFESTLGNIVPWDRMAAECQDRKMLMRESCKQDKWLLKEDCSDFDEKSILNCGEEEEDSKLIKPLRHDRTVVTDSNIGGMQVDRFYPDNAKWFDSPTCLDTGADSGDGGFRHEGLL